jgi:rhomboid protease GluP
MPNSLTISLVAINSIIYLIQELIPSAKLVELGALYLPYMLEYNQWYRLISYMFLHNDITHILMNMFSLYIIGKNLEMYFGFKSYLFIYFLSGIVGAIFSIIVHPIGIVVGASGAIFGLFGALAGFFVAKRDYINKNDSKSLIKQFGIILLLNLIIGLSIPNVDISAHIGGLITGFISAFLITKFKG